MPLEILSRAPASPTGKPPLLFVHGAWHAAWCWDDHFLPFFAEHGYAAHAVSLRGHGGTSGSLRFASLTEYVDTVAAAVDSLPAKPTLIGHSMGGLVVQRYLMRRPAPGGVLIASAPPHGVWGVTLKIARTHPLLFLRANLTLSLEPLVDSKALTRELFFSADADEAVVARCHARLQDESYRAFLDMLGLGLPKTAEVKTPLLVLGGANDAIFPPHAVEATARAYATQAQILPGLAHDMMLEARWRDAAAVILDWLETRFSVPA